MAGAKVLLDRRVAMAIAMVMVLCIAAGAAPVWAARITLPIIGSNPTRSLDDPDLINLDQPDGYSISFAGSAPVGFTGAVGQVLDIAVTFSIDQSGAPESPLGALLVISSIRAAGSLVCSTEGGSSMPPRAPFGFVEGSLTGVDDVLFVSDPLGPGTLCDEEGVEFLAVEFVGQPDARQFEFQLQVTEPLALPGDLQFQIVNDAFAIVPEPSTLLLVALGMAGLSRAHRAARHGS